MSPQPVALQPPTLLLVWPAEQVEIDLHALQGLWSDEQYMRLTEGTNRLIEFTAGVLEVLPMPTNKHQRIFTLPVSGVAGDVATAWWRCIVRGATGANPPRQIPGAGSAGGP